MSTISLNSIYHKWYKTLSGILYMYCICCHSFVCVVFSSKSEARSVKVFIWFVYIYIVAGDPFIKRVDWNPSDLFNPISFLCQSHDRTWMTGGYFYHRPPLITADHHQTPPTSRKLRSSTNMLFLIQQFTADHCWPLE